MSTFPGSPRLLKGAIVGLDPFNPVASIIVFQYNPETLTRRLDARATGGGEAADRSEPFRLRTAPSETITLAVTVDATDQLEVADDLAVRAGVGPALSALEMLLYPKSTLVVANAVLAQLGNLEIIPPQAPLTVFVWGAQRVLPVRLTGFSITEQAHDAQLNPILATVDLTLTVLSYADLKITDPGYTLFLAYQIAKELMASSNPAGSLLSTGASLPLS
jgi:hypothetical protein